MIFNIYKNAFFWYTSVIRNSMNTPNQNKKGRSSKRYLLLCIFGAVLFLLVIILVLSGKQPTPTLITDNGSTALSLDGEVVIDFDWPVERNIKFTISPHVYGSIEYSDMMYGEHLARRLVFRPEVTWLPGATYEISLINVKSALLPYQNAQTHAITFTTATEPQIVSLEPTVETEIRPDTAWTAKLDKPNVGSVGFEFQFEPDIESDVVLSDDKMVYTITPKMLLSQGGSYTLKVNKKVLRHLLGTDEVAYQSEEEEVWSGAWDVREAPGIESFEPHGSTVTMDNQIQVQFSENVDFDSFKEKVAIEPELKGTWETEDYKTLTFDPANLQKDTTYSVTIQKGLETFGGGYLEEDSVHTFTTIGPVTIARSSPANGNGGIGVNSAVQITFDQQVDHSSAEERFSIDPIVDGAFSWEGNTMTFTPSTLYAFNTTHTVTLAAGIKSVIGFDSVSEQTVAFATELSVTKLTVPFHRQEHNLSCEIATLVMALAYRDIHISEAEIISFIGIDPPLQKENGVWGNPHIAFVGDIDGHQPSTGYGVYWQPIANAAQQYGSSSYWFTGWTLQQLTAEIQKGNPVIVWGTAGSGSRIDWQTPTGGNVVAVNGEHTRTVIGYIGSAEDPSTIITLDPLSGEKYFTKDSFLWNWGLLNNSGVVVE